VIVKLFTVAHNCRTPLGGSPVKIDTCHVLRTSLICGFPDLNGICAVVKARK
jgi:hypothetical protein